VSVLDAVAQFSLPLDPRLPKQQVLGSATASATSEAAPKVATRLSLSPQSITEHKAAAILAVTSELARSSGALRLIANELRNAVARATNAIFLAALDTSSATAGATAAASLAAALDKLGNCRQVVVAAPFATVRELALASDGRMSLTGGNYVPGVQVVAADVTDLFAIPADRVTLWQSNIEIHPSSDATVQLDDDPDSGAAAQISLWQHNLHGLLCERLFRVYGECVKVTLT
jgi:hypothetical protein